MTSGSFFITDVLVLAASRSVRTSDFPNVMHSRLLGGYGARAEAAGRPARRADRGRRRNTTLRAAA
ncbi:hypothetical protein TPA0910_10350 [Streptomyces hygroscopicus subsp. sporocinereus]|uniref:Uncharacterized protein n=1 Tax=Streptomyces hygroscopicus TaxID=1912 RepID=A0ABQ3TTF0_STRHY|nr:hypothetical protein TPA0910_10350 [Streptomyces hygroscopicus]